MSRDDGLRDALRDTLGATLLNVTPVGGGSISAAFRIDTHDGPVFAKSGTLRSLASFHAESEGLQALARCDEIAVPEPLGVCSDDTSAFLFMSWLDLAPMAAADHERLGEALAALHTIGAPQFGWDSDNFIGATPQPNGWSDSWSEFFVSRRLDAQLAHAAAHGYAGRVSRLGDLLRDVIPAILACDGLEPSLVHGDLWSGNRGVTAAGKPALYDPAVHFADAESDLAMSELFGGFSAGFYASYAACRPPRGDVGARRDVYRLYHLLNHLNLFGAGYLAQCLALMNKIFERHRI